ncbi:MAG: DUF192 domain-containing protein [Candidatus Eremiobacterota bacterium]
MKSENLIITKRYIIYLILFLFCITGCKSEARSPVSTMVFEKKTLTVKDRTITVEIADTSEKRMTGLMYRKSLGKNEGMLFIFSGEEIHSFWMKNTLIPLSIAFIKEDGTIIHIEDMEPQTETTHPSKYPVKYALEVNKGWFKENNITVGDKILVTGH